MIKPRKTGRRPADTEADAMERAAAYLPLGPVAFEVMLSLAGGAQHGYAILRDIEARTGGEVSLHAGTLYRALFRLVEQELVEELEERPSAEADDARRRYYGMTALGRQVAAAEAKRLANRVATARDRKLLRQPRSV
jgi:DNA-binding PadR family transcriptional regulator